MNFDLSEEQQLFQSSVEQILSRELDAIRLRGIFDGETGHDEQLWRGLMELGLGGVLVSSEYGGLGVEFLNSALVAEILGRYGAPGPFLGHALAGYALTLAGSEEQKQKWLPSLCDGTLIGTIAFGEQGNRWQPEDWTLEAGNSLLGAKKNVPYGELADILIVGLQGGQLGVVEKGASGLSVQSVDGVDRTRRFVHLKFEDVAFELLSNDPQDAYRVRDAGLNLLAADAFGGAARCVEMSVEYAKEREQFGATIGHFQGLKHQLANMAQEVEPARGLYWYASHAFDQVEEEAPRMAALAKAHLTECYMDIARRTVEAHGGIGYTWECEVQIWVKRAMFDRAFLGAPSEHFSRAAAMADW